MMVGTFRTRLMALVALLVWLPLAQAEAQLNATGVVYALTPQNFGSAQQFVLVPMPTDAVRTDVPVQSAVPAAFGVLRDAKGVTYGNSSLRMTDADLRQKQVAVMIDPAVAEYAGVIEAETVYTFTQLGLEKVVFPGHHDKGLTRADVAYAAYRQQVPFWQALPPAKLFQSDIVMADRSLVDSTSFYARLADGDAKLKAAALELLASRQTAEVMAGLGAIQSLSLAGFEAKAAPLLKHPDPAVRDTTLRALATSRVPAGWDLIASVLDTEPEPVLRNMIAGMLKESPLVPYRLLDVFFRSRSGDLGVRLAAIAELAKNSDSRVAPELVSYLAAPEPEIAAAAVEALHVAKNWGALMAAMENSKLTDEVRLAAATAISADGATANRATAMEFRAFQLVGAPAVGTVEAIERLQGNDPRAALERFLGHPTMAVRTRVAELLAERKSTASLPALVVAVKQNGENAAVLTALDESIYAITLSQAIGGITSQASGKEDLLRRAAYRALGALAAAGKANAGVIDRLKAGLTDASPGIRGASARALAATRTQEAFDAILALQDDPKPAVVGDLALALGSFNDAAIVEKAKEILVGFLQSGEPEVAAGALDSIGALGFIKLLPVALDKVSHPDGRVRAAAIRAASLLADNASTRSVLNAIIGRLRDEELSNQVLAATLLGKFSNDIAVLGLSQAVNEPIPELRFATIAALGATRHPGAANVLLALFDDNDREIRLAAATAMGKLALKSTLQDLDAAAGRAADPATAEAIRKAIETVKQTGR